MSNLAFITANRPTNAIQSHSHSHSSRSWSTFICILLVELFDGAERYIVL